MVRLAAIGLRRYTAETENRDCSSRLLLTSALRMFVDQAGAKEAAAVVLGILTEDPKDAA